MNRPSKKEIAERIRQLKESKDGGSGHFEAPTLKPQEKKANKNRIRKKGV